MQAEQNYVDDILTRKIIGLCYEVHCKLGPGFVEKTYLTALKKVFTRDHIDFMAEKEFPVVFDGEMVGKFRTDLVVAGKVIVELKSVEGSIPKIYESQVVSYLKASGLKVGLLVNFGNRKCIVRRLVSSP
jgi:GxxExxY protein